MRRPTLADEVMAELLNYNGVPTRRIDVIRDLESKGLSRTEVDWHMFLLGQQTDVEKARCVQTGPLTWSYGG
jgi:hypothetical protein